ncbi:mitochondrial carrier [Rickenella mellea]|uniref:Mitochondrial carrier n=1 Tax=Rickenella mellea TaxID=50990 RepID=A0A4Y7Q6M3_9AGAM|nr:mitochondrial carrier [Rickenella mellea]
MNLSDFLVEGRGADTNHDLTVSFSPAPPTGTASPELSSTVADAESSEKCKQLLASMESYLGNFNVEVDQNCAIFSPYLCPYSHWTRAAVSSANRSAGYAVRVDMQTKEQPVTLIYKAAISQSTGEPSPPVPIQQTRFAPAPKPIFTKTAVRKTAQALEEMEESDDDMGFGTFDGDDPSMVTENSTFPLQEMISVPKEDTKTHLKAKIKNASDYTLLSGYASVYGDGSFIRDPISRQLALKKVSTLLLGSPINPNCVSSEVQESHPLRVLSEDRKSRLSQRITIFNSTSTAVDNVKIVDQIPVSEDSQTIVNMSNPALTLPPSSAITIANGKPPQPVDVSSGIKAQWDGTDEPDFDMTALGKDGKINWVCSVPAQEKVNLHLHAIIVETDPGAEHAEMGSGIVGERAHFWRVYASWTFASPERRPAERSGRGRDGWRGRGCTIFDLATPAVPKRTRPLCSVFSISAAQIEGQGLQGLGTRLIATSHSSIFRGYWQFRGQCWLVSPGSRWNKVTNDKVEGETRSRYSCSIKSALAILRRIVTHRGLAGLYDGLKTDTAATLLSNTSKSGQSIQASSAVEAFVALEELSIGFVAGVASRAISTPLALITVRLQDAKDAKEKASDNDDDDELEENPDVVSIVKQIYSTDGLFGFWKAFRSVFLRGHDRGTPSPRQAFIGAAFSNAIGGSFASTSKYLIFEHPVAILYPLMLAKTRLQTSRSRSIMDLWKAAYKRDGLAGLYQGVEVQLLKGFLNQGLTMATKQR